MPAEGMTSGEFIRRPMEIVSDELFVVVLGGGRVTSLMHRLGTRTNRIGAKLLFLVAHKVGNTDAIALGQTDETLTIFPCVTLIELLAHFAALYQHLNPDRFRLISKVTRNE